MSSSFFLLAIKNDEEIEMYEVEREDVPPFSKFEKNSARTSAQVRAQSMTRVLFVVLGEGDDGDEEGKQKENSSEDDANTSSRRRRIEAL